MTNVAFDVDNTLIKKNELGEDVPNYDILWLLLKFVEIGCNVHVWSGGGKDYAKRWSEKLGILGKVWIIEKKSLEYMDISFDDQEVELAKVNIVV